MKQTIRSITLGVACICSLCASMLAQTVQGRFVAFDRFGGINSHAPVQQLIVQIETKNKNVASNERFPDGLLIKAAFLPISGGMGGTVKILEQYHLNYSRLWILILRSPTESEKRFCDFDNYIRFDNGNVDSNDKGEPTMNFYSTQFDGWVIFPKLPTMRCLIIESLSDGDLTIRSRNTKNE